jgi:hypothetical protein
MRCWSIAVCGRNRPRRRRSTEDGLLLSGLLQVIGKGPHCADLFFWETVQNLGLHAGNGRDPCSASATGLSPWNRCGSSFPSPVYGERLGWGRTGRALHPPRAPHPSPPPRAGEGGHLLRRGQAARSPPPRAEEGAVDARRDDGFSPRPHAGSWVGSELEIRDKGFGKACTFDGFVQSGQCGPDDHADRSGVQRVDG